MIELAPGDPTPTDHVGEGYSIELLESMIGHQRGMCVARRWPRFTTITYHAFRMADPGVVKVSIDTNKHRAEIRITALNGWASYLVIGHDRDRRLAICEFVEGEYREVLR